MAECSSYRFTAALLPLPPSRPALPKRTWAHGALLLCPPAGREALLAEVSESPPRGRALTSWLCRSRVASVALAAWTAFLALVSHAGRALPMPTCADP